MAAQIDTSSVRCVRRALCGVQQALAMADPSEPKYCQCQRISFGEMIACENPGGCVGGQAGEREGAFLPVDCTRLELAPTACPRPSPRPCHPHLATDCPYEWFHFGCVGLTEETRPKGACVLVEEQCCLRGVFRGR